MTDLDAIAKRAAEAKDMASRLKYDYRLLASSDCARVMEGAAADVEALLGRVRDLEAEVKRNSTALARAEREENALRGAFSAALHRQKEAEERAENAEAELAAIHAEKRQDMIDGLRGKMGLATLLHKTEAELARVTAEAAVMREALKHIATHPCYKPHCPCCYEDTTYAKDALSSTSAGAGLLKRLEASEAVAEAAEKRFLTWNRDTYAGLAQAIEAWRKSKESP